MSRKTSLYTGTMSGNQSIIDGPVRAAALKALEEAARARESELCRLYQELLFAVAKKHPGETRHATALRYIRQAEAPVVDRPDCMPHNVAEQE